MCIRELAHRISLCADAPVRISGGKEIVKPSMIRFISKSLDFSPGRCSTPQPTTRPKDPHTHDHAQTHSFALHPTLPNAPLCLICFPPFLSSHVTMHLSTSARGLHARSPSLCRFRPQTIFQPEPGPDPEPPPRPQAVGIRGPGGPRPRPPASASPIP